MGNLVIRDKAFYEWVHTQTNTIMFPERLNSIGKYSFAYWYDMLMGIDFVNTYYTGPNQDSVIAIRGTRHSKVYIDNLDYFDNVPIVGTIMCGYNGIDNDNPNDGPYFFISTVITIDTDSNRITTSVITDNMPHGVDITYSVNSIVYDAQFGRQSNITTIDDYAFKDWQSNMYTPSVLEFPSSITYIGKGAFDGWFNNILGIDISHTNLTTIKDSSFKNWVNAIGVDDLTIPGNVTSIEDYAFYGWEKYEYSVNLSYAIETIGKYAFAHWKSASSPVIEKDLGTHPYIRTKLFNTHDKDITVSNNPPAKHFKRDPIVNIVYTIERKHLTIVYLDEVLISTYGDRYNPPNHTPWWIWTASIYKDAIGRAIALDAITKGIWSVSEARYYLEISLYYTNHVHNIVMYTDPHWNDMSGHYRLFYTDDVNVRNSDVNKDRYNGWRLYYATTPDDDADKIYAFEIGWESSYALSTGNYAGSVDKDLVINSNDYSPCSTSTLSYDSTGDYTPTSDEYAYIYKIDGGDFPSTDHYISHLHIPYYIKTIKMYAFYDWATFRGRPNMELSHSLEYIGRSAFRGWKKGGTLTIYEDYDWIVIPESVTTIEDNAFDDGFPDDLYIEFRGVTPPAMGYHSINFSGQKINVIVPDNADITAYKNTILHSPALTILGDVIFKKDAIDHMVWNTMSWS